MLTGSVATQAGKRSWIELFRPAVDRPMVPQFGTEICKFPVGQVTPRNVSLSPQLVSHVGKWSSSQERSTKAVDVYSCWELKVNYFSIHTFVGKCPEKISRVPHKKARIPGFNQRACYQFTLHVCVR